ncbi:MAG: AAA family ATPase [Candidatus Bathyarchaeota archaeon]
MSFASQELEKLAINAATEAIQLDKQGLRQLAVSKYQRASEILKKLCVLHPNVNQTRVYMDYIKQYDKRVKELKGQEAQEVEGQLDSNEKPDDLILWEKPDVKWSDIVGLEEVKKAIEESIIYPYRRSDLFPLGWPRGILFFGPPGCGKTLLAAATANEIDAAFYNVDAASIMSKWLGESERNVARLFGSARRVSESGRAAIIFIDEVDSLVGVRSEEVGGEVRMRNQFMKETDSIVDKSKKLHIYLIGATNKPWSLEESFIRRFQKRIYVSLPGVNSRRGMFELYIKKLLQVSGDISFDELAKISGGYSGSDIHDIVQAVHLRVVREFFTRGKADDPQAKLRLITMKDFSEVMLERRPSVSKDLLTHYERWFEQFKAL